MSHSHTTRLPGIKRIGILPCAMMPANIADQYFARLTIALPSRGLEIPFCGIPICESTSEYNNNGSQEKATLTFASSQFIAEKAQLAFVVTDVNGYNYVIGAREKPYPIVSRTQNTGSPDAEGAVFSYEITHVALKSMIECAI